MQRWGVRRALEALLPIRRLTRSERLVVGLLWVVGVAQGYAQAQAASTVPFTRAALGISVGDMSSILALTRLAGFGALAISHWGDRTGRRRAFLLALTLLFLSGGGTALVVAPWQFTVSQSLVRLSAAAATTLGVVILAEHVSPALRAFAISIYGAAGSLGAGLALVALPIAGMGLQTWRVPFAISTVGLLVLPLLSRRITESSVFMVDGTPARVPLGDLVTGPFARRFWIAAAAGFLASGFNTVALAFSTQRLIGDLGMSTAQAVLISLTGGTLGGAGFFVGGRLADVWGRRPMTVVALLLGAVGGTGLYWLSDPVLLTLSVLVGTFGSFAFVPAAGAHRAELFPTAFRVTAGTAATNLGMLGSAAGLLVGRLTIDPFGLPRTVAGLAAGAVIAAALTLLLPETRGQALEVVRPDR